MCWGWQWLIISSTWEFLFGLWQTDTVIWVFRGQLVTPWPLSGMSRVRNLTVWVQLLIFVSVAWPFMESFQSQSATQLHRMFYVTWHCITIHYMLLKEWFRWQPMCSCSQCKCMLYSMQSYCIVGSVLHCAGLHPIVLHLIVLHLIVLPLLYCLYCITSYYIASYCITTYCIAFYCIASYCIVWYSFSFLFSISVLPMRLLQGSSRLLFSWSLHHAVLVRSGCSSFRSFLALFIQIFLCLPMLLFPSTCCIVLYCITCTVYSFPQFSLLILKPRQNNSFNSFDDHRWPSHIGFQLFMAYQISTKYLKRTLSSLTLVSRKPIIRSCLWARSKASYIKLLSAWVSWDGNACRNRKVKGKAIKRREKEEERRCSRWHTKKWLAVDILILTDWNTFI